MLAHLSHCLTPTFFLSTTDEKVKLEKKELEKMFCRRAAASKGSKKDKEKKK